MVSRDKGNTILRSADQTPSQAGRESESVRQATPIAGNPFAAPLPSEFRRLGVLGQGAYAVVYKAVAFANPDQTVAVKVLKQFGDSVRDERLRKRFEVEQLIQSTLRHEGILQARRSGPQTSRHYVTDVAASSMAATLTENESNYGIGSPSFIASQLPRLRSLCEALAFIHAQGIVHRDVKPANILLDALGRPLLADFGTAALSGEGRGLDPELRRKLMSLRAIEGVGHGKVGTLAYAAPEQGQASPSAAMDQFAVGMVLFRILVNAEMFGNFYAVSRSRAFDWAAEVRSFLTVSNNLPAASSRITTDELVVLRARKMIDGILAVAERATARDPADRYPSITDVGQELDRVLHGKTPDAGKVGIIKLLSGLWDTSAGRTSGPGCIDAEMSVLRARSHG